MEIVMGIVMGITIKSRFWLVLASLILLAGCQSTTTELTAVRSFHDQIFPAYHTIEIETERQVFALSAEARHFVREKLLHINDPKVQIEALVGGIFNHADLNLLYNNDANTIASETFANRAANCISLTIMTYAMANYANLGVHFQQVDIPEFWVRRGGYNLLNGHVNLRLYPKTDNSVLYARTKSFELDFDPLSLPMRMPTRQLSKRQILAMFYNNKGADALIKANYTRAYAYFRASLQQDPLFASAWTNMGVIYRLNGRLDYAEESYLQALAIDGDNSTGWENLAFLYNMTGRYAKANRIDARLKKQRLNNPNYHFMLGEIEYDKQAWRAAIKHYRRAVKLDKRRHEFYFALAKSYFQSGDIQRSKKFMRQAKKHAGESNDDARRYQGKLNLLSSL